MYLDSAYLTKFYVNEVDSDAVRAAILAGQSRVSSAWAIPELTCALHRHVRDGVLSSTQAEFLLDQFLTHVDNGVWKLVPVTDRLLRHCSALVASLPAGVYLRAGDAIHLTTAADMGELEIWTNDRHLLAAAPYFGLAGHTA